MSLLTSYTEDELDQIIKVSNSWRDFARNLGYNAFSGKLKKILEEYCIQKNKDTSHFSTVARSTIRTEDNVFCENSTADQKVLREWYYKNKYTPYTCSICGLSPEWQGQPLTLILDHINGHNHDNRLENLRWVCPNCNQQLETTNGKNRKKLYKKNFCIDCGKEIDFRSTRCKNCASKKTGLEQPRKVEDRPSRDELKVLIRENSMTKIGNLYGVSDNTIRKWCKAYNLPHKVHEIKNYSNEEWNNL